MFSSTFFTRDSRATSIAVDQRHRFDAGLALFVCGHGSVLATQNLLSQRVHALALLVHHVVVFEQVLSNVEVALLDLLLRVLDGACHPAMLDGDVLFHPEAVHHRLDALAGEDPHQVVFEREEET